MADYKNYIVNYNITANTAEAAEGIRRMAAEAKAAADWLKPIQQGIRQISQSAKVLANSANKQFTPTIQTSAFNAQLREMVVAVNAAANEMRAAIDNALIGTKGKTPSPVKNARAGWGKDYEGKTKSELAAFQKAHRARLREITKANGDLEMVKRGLAQYPNSANLQTKFADLTKEEQDLRSRIEHLQKLIPTAPKTKQATSTSQKPTATPASNVSKPGVIDTAFLKQYQRMFGSAKSVTLKINANATGPKGALTVIAQVADSMRALQAQSSFTISPLLNPEAFAAAEAQLRGLARLSGAVVAPFGGTTGTTSKGSKGAKAGRGAKVGKAAATPLAVDVVGKITSITPPKTELVVPVIGEMTKILNKISEAIPVNVRISASSIDESIKTMKRPVIPASIKLMWDKGAIGRQEQLKNIQSKIPPIKLTLDTAGAIAKLEEFIALVKANSPQNINLTATGTASGGSGRTGAAGRGTGRGTTGVQPLASGTWQERATRQYKAQKYRAQLHNSLLPFGLNKSQMDMVKKYYRYFRQGARVSGISPTVDMQPSQMKQYLQAVSGQMQASNLAVPYQLQSYMSRLDKQIAGKPVGRSVSVGVPQEEKQFYDRARKWAYPFAGNTSFGARTPMAVDMAKGMGVTYALTGAMSAIGNSFSQAMEYQNTMQTTKTILQNGTDTYSQSNFRNMEEMVREVGIKTKYSAPEVANAARFLAMAGYNIDDINNSIRPIADLALIGDLDLGETADKMTNIMTTFGIKSAMMRDAANIMATTATRSNTDLMMLAESAKYGGGMARLYGSSRENPLENFAETMAIFGVMGNAGVQGSSAGTALRMMYMNLFNPNTKQLKVHEKLLADYGISMYQDEAKTKRRSLADIIMDMAANIPQEQMADLVSKLFRITATSGASSVLQAAGVDENNAQQSLAENEAIVAQLNKGNQFSQLAQLIKANVASIGGNVSGIFGEAKQNTISGLLAQVTSTFTEGVVKAFEQRQGSFEGVLKGLRDYLARPQTVEMIQKLLDMIIEVGKALAWFIDLWAKLYSLAPDAITAWIKWQMIFTQIGSLISPAIQLVGAFNRLGGALASLLGISLTGVTAVGGAAVGRVAAGGAAAVGSTAASAAMYAPLMLGTTSNGRPITVSGNLAARTRRQFEKNAQIPVPVGVNADKMLADTNTRTRRQAMAVKLRHDRIYGHKRVLRALKTSNLRSMANSGAQITMGMLSLKGMGFGISNILTGLIGGIAKAIGALINPATAVVAAIGGVGYGLYKLIQYATGSTDAQIAAQQRMVEAGTEMQKAMYEQGKWYLDKLKELQNTPEPTSSSRDNATLEATEKQRRDYQKRYAALWEDLGKDPSEQNVNIFLKNLRDIIGGNPQNLLAFKEGEFESMLEDGIVDSSHTLSYTGNADVDSGIGLINLFGKKDNAVQTQLNSIPLILRTAGLDTPEIIQAHNDIIALRKEYLSDDKAKKIKTEEQYQEAVKKIINSVADPDRPGLFPSNTLKTIGQVQNIKDLTQYKDVVVGQNNFLWNTANGVQGTYVGYLNAAYDFPNELKDRTDKFWEKVNNIVATYPKIISIVTEKDGPMKTIYQLSFLSNGNIDFENILEHIKQSVSEFEATLGDYADMAATAYNLLSKLGIEDGSEKGARQYIKNQIKDLDLNEKTLREYWQTHIGTDVNSEWKKWGFDEDKYVKFMLNKHEDGYESVIKWGGRTVKTQSQEKNQIIGNLSKQAAIAAGLTPNKDEVPGLDQNKYTSHYNTSATKPTAIVNNITVNFDHTAVASSVEERDLMATMETKLSGVAAQFFAQLVNQAAGNFA